MTEETCDRYITFLLREIDDCLQHQKLEDSNMVSVSNEVLKFQERVASSSLPAAILTRAKELEFHYNPNQVERKTMFRILRQVALGRFAGGSDRKVQQERQRHLEDLRSDLHQLRMALLMGNE